VAAWFAHRMDEQNPVAGESSPPPDDPAIRLVFAGDPGRGLPPCAACHGPGAHKLGAPALRGQHSDYIEGQLLAFAQGTRRNDINQQMRTIAVQLTPGEMRAAAAYYGADRALPATGK
jgi:cytochrome c553